MKNSGKKFEHIIREQFEKLPEVSVDRINDIVGYGGAYNIADLIVYRKPFKYYFELKTIKGTSFPFSNINQKALTDMQYQCIKNGVACYFLIWFIDLDLTIAVHANEIYVKYHAMNKKSIGVKSFSDFEYVVVDGVKKRKYFEYDLIGLLNKLDGEML